MAYIESFTIHGLAGRDSPVSRKLDRNVNVFWGLNGSGKTSLLKILHSAMENDDASLERVPFERAEVFIRTTGSNRSIVRTYDAAPASPSSSSLELEGLEDLREIALLRREKRTRTGWSTVVLDGDDHPSDSGRFRHSFLPISRVSQSRSPSTSNAWRTSGERQAIDDPTFDELFADQVRRRWQLYSNTALLEIREIQQQGLASILAVLFGGEAGMSTVEASPVAAEQAFSLVRDFLGAQRIQLRVGRHEFIKRYEQEEDLRQVVANIQGVTEEVEVVLQPQVEFQSIIEDLYSGNKHLVLSGQAGSRNNLQIEIDGRAIPLQSLSSGEKQLLQLLLEILAAESSTVMIDEPELSMHVDWQQRLVASMVRVNPTCQLLLATHSPEVMAEVDDRYVFEL